MSNITQKPLSEKNNSISDFLREQIYLGNYLIFYMIFGNIEVKDIDDALDIFDNLLDKSNYENLEKRENEFKPYIVKEYDEKKNNFLHHFEAYVSGYHIRHYLGDEEKLYKGSKNDYWENGGGKIIYQRLGYSENQELNIRKVFWDFNKIVFTDFGNDKTKTILLKLFRKNDWKTYILFVLKLYQNKNKVFYKKFELFLSYMFDYYINNKNWINPRNFSNILQIFTSFLIENGIEITAFIASIKFFVDAVLYSYFNGGLNSKIIAYCFAASGLSSYFIYNYIKDSDFYKNIEKKVKQLLKKITPNFLSKIYKDEIEEKIEE